MFERFSILKNLDLVRSALLGSARARKENKHAIASCPSPSSGIDAVIRRVGEKALPASNTDSPIFVFSAGWRSGSTLLQRLVLSDPQVLLWGEPYDKCALVPRMMQTLVPFTDSWPPENYFLSDRGATGTLSDEWVANLYPDLNQVRLAHRTFFDSLLAEPALSLGAVRWGFKEVRLGGDAAKYLKWLYPNAKFVFLYRNPFDAFSSYRKHGAPWYLSWPDEPVFTPTAFGHLWKRLTTDFLTYATELDAHLVKFEDLASSVEAVEALANYLDLALRKDVVEKRVGSSRSVKDNGLWLPAIDRYLLRRAVSPLAQELGYHAP